MGELIRVLAMHCALRWELFANTSPSVCDATGVFTIYG